MKYKIKQKVQSVDGTIKGIVVRIFTKHKAQWPVLVEVSSSTHPRYSKGDLLLYTLDGQRAGGANNEDLI